MTTTTEARAIAVNRYHNKNGKHQSAYDEAWKLIPGRGLAHEKTLETLRRTSNAYADIYEMNGTNSILFEGMGAIVDESPLSGLDAIKLKEVFKYIAEGRAQIVLGGECPQQQSELYEDDPEFIEWLKSCSIFYEKDFGEPLEQLMDWAVLEAWMEHC